MQDPERYETFKGHALRDANEFVPKMLADMTWGKEEKVMDYGCGAGSTGAKLILPQLEKFDSTLYSVDVSTNMLEYAKRKYPNPRITYALGNILDPHFPFRHIQFDKIFGVYVLHYIRDYRNAVRQFYANLKPGGQAGFSVIAWGCYFDSSAFLGKSEKWAIYMKGYSKFLPEWFEKNENAENVFRSCLKETGFEIVTMSAETKEYLYDKIDSLVELQLSLNPFITNIPKEEYADFKNDLRDFLTNKWKVERDAASVKITYDTLYFVVRKPEGKGIDPHA